MPRRNHVGQKGRHLTDLAALEEQGPRLLEVLRRERVEVVGSGLARTPDQQVGQALPVVTQAAHRPMQQLERLLVRGQRRGALGGHRRRDGGLGELTGLLVVGGPVRVAAELDPGARLLRHPRVQGSAPGQRRARLDGVPDQRVAVPEPPG